MKRFASVPIAAALLAAALFLGACSDQVKLSFGEDGLLADKSGNQYLAAPVGYEPSYQGEEYGKIDDLIGEVLYRVGDLDPDQWLTGEYAGAATSFFYSSDITLPTLWEMHPTACFLCMQDENIYSICTIGDGSRSGNKDADAKVIEQLTEIMHNAIESGESESIWPRADVNETYQLKFYTEEWPAFYYNLVYVSCGGGNFIYDRNARICASVGDLLTPYYAEDYPKDSSDTTNATV